MTERSSSLRRTTRTVFVLASAVAVVAIVLGVVSFRSLLDARERILDRLDPAVTETERYLAALVNQESGVRAYVLTSSDTFLDPYRLGQQQESTSAESLIRLVADASRTSDDFAAVMAASQRWHTEYVEPTLAAIDAGETTGRSDEALLTGREYFDEIRASVATLQADLTSQRAAARSDLSDATRRLIITLIAASAVMVSLVGVLWALIQRSVQRPLDTLGAEAEIVSGGDVDHVIGVVGPQELRDLGMAMEAMRIRIVSELRTSSDALITLEAVTEDLRRSNAELEQFAYVASHDLQEPLRKVASFCQLLQTRYAEQLDPRANQYIDFAVDGAKRMQALINDLLAFSRVGRVTAEFVRVDLGEVVQNAISNLATAIDESAATVTVGPLPTVAGERALLGAVFQNLIGNAIKYRRADLAPVVDVTVTEEEGLHHFVVSDNGIGIEPEFAERVFVIFQRLHSKEQYEGTGIGLALCRKIVEYHGGTIWAATDVGVGGGTVIHFTLPILPTTTTTTTTTNAEAGPR